jgi:hypothetical protein
VSLVKKNSDISVQGDTSGKLALPKSLGAIGSAPYRAMGTGGEIDLVLYIQGCLKKRGIKELNITIM